MNKEIQIAEELKDLEVLEEMSNKELESEAKIEREIEEYKETIATSLLSRQTGLTINLDGRMFAVGYKVENKERLGKKYKELVFIVIDPMLAKLSNKKQGQTTLRLDYVKAMSLKSNLVAAAEAWLRHVTKQFKAEHDTNDE